MPNRQLRFVSSLPRDGATDVSPRRRSIVLNFNQDVVADSVWRNNRTQIRLYREGTRVRIRVRRSRAFANRHKIYVRPVHRLHSCTDYRVDIRPDLTARNRRKLGKTVNVHFQTGTRRPEE